MSMMPFDREWPVFQGSRPFFEPFGSMESSNNHWGSGSMTSGAMAPWQDFVTPFKQMEQQMRKLDRQFSEMSQQMSMQMSQRMPMQMNKLNQDPYVVDSDGKRMYRLNFDLRQYKPEEIHVKTHNNMLSVHAKHESDGESGKLYREFQQQFTIPEGIQLHSMSSVLRPDGVLCVEAPVPATFKPVEQSAIQKKPEVPIAIEHK